MTRKRKNNLDRLKAAPGAMEILDRLFEHGAIGKDMVPNKLYRILDNEGMIECKEIDEREWVDLSGEGRYFMTGDHSAIDEPSFYGIRKRP